MPIEPSIATQVLEKWGATVTSIPESSDEEADLLATLNGCRLLIEEKTKLDDPANQRARQLALDTGQLRASTLPIIHNNRISGVIRKAADQLTSTSNRVEHDLRVLWFTGVGFDAEAKHLQLIATLYGSTNIIDSISKHIKECYFFRNSDFYRYRNHFDGAIAAHLNGHAVTMKLCLNPYSANWEALRDSPYAQKFLNGPIDPLAQEARGEVYIADTDTDRNHESAVLNYLQQKYGLQRPVKMDMMMASVAINFSE
jgi:hypothetical protein